MITSTVTRGSHRWRYLWLGTATASAVVATPARSFDAAQTLAWSYVQRPAMRQIDHERRSITRLTAMQRRLDSVLRPDWHTVSGKRMVGRSTRCRT